MAQRLMGFETELAFTCTGPDERPYDRAEALGYINAAVQGLVPYLPCHAGGGVFLSNGGRLYVDMGPHEEWATPECADPTELVRYQLAGEKLLVDAAAHVVERGILRSATFMRGNIDYAGNTWGSHENYLHRADPSRLPDDLLPFLVSRTVITGAGGFCPSAPGGCLFSLSPRSAYINTAITSSSTSGRGIYHTKDESLSSDGFHRLHVLLGESLCSETGNWDKAATTTLAVCLCEACVRPGQQVALQSPVEALHAFAGDPTCKATAALVKGGRISAIQIQRHYLELAKGHLWHPSMPPWAPQAVEAWERILNRLEQGSAGVAGCLDWAIKYHAFSSRVRKAGFTWELLDQWSRVVSLLRKCAEAMSRADQPAAFTGAAMIDPNGPLGPVVRELTPHLQARGMRWEQMPAFHKLRLELFECDLRFGQLGKGGLFSAIDAAGVLDHHVPGVENIEEATTTPPQSSRAKVRGDFIRRARQRERYNCDWSGIYDSHRRRMMDTSNPFAERQHWVTCSVADACMF